MFQPCDTPPKTDQAMEKEALDTSLIIVNPFRHVDANYLKRDKILEHN